MGHKFKDSFKPSLGMMLLLLHWPIVLLISSMSFLYTRHNPHFFTKLEYVLLILIPISQNPFASHSHNIFLSFFPNCWGSKYNNQIWSDEATTSLSMMCVRDISFPLALNMQETGLPWIWWCGRGQNTMQTTIPIQSLHKLVPDPRVARDYYYYFFKRGLIVIIIL